MCNCVDYISNSPKVREKPTTKSGSGIDNIFEKPHSDELGLTRIIEQKYNVKNVAKVCYIPSIRIAELNRQFTVLILNMFRTN